MSAFPLGLPGPTTLYMMLYLVSWVVHFFLAGAVLGGAFVAALDALRGGPAELDRRRTAAAIAAALPLLLGLAITAGVAPLLFVQILYRDAFYTANVLLFIRYLAVLPALLACFYLFYLARSKRAAGWTGPGRAILWAVAGALAVFIGWSNVELHSLSVDPGVWVSHYAAGGLVYVRAAVGLRLGMFIGLAMVMTAACGAGLARFAGHARTAVTLAPLALAGGALSLGFAALYGRTLAPESVESLRSPSALVHLSLLAVAAIALFALWASAWARGGLGTTARRLVVASSIAWLWSVAVLRELIRGAELDLPSRFEFHRHAAETGGVLVFVAFALINGVAVGWCLTRVWRNAGQGS